MIHLARPDALLAPPAGLERFAALCEEVAASPGTAPLDLDRPCEDSTFALAPHVRRLRVDRGDRALWREVSRGHCAPGPVTDDLFVVLFRQDDRARWHLLPPAPWALLGEFDGGRRLGDAVAAVCRGTRNPFVFARTWPVWMGLFGRKGLLTGS